MIAETEREGRLAENFVAALFESLLETDAVELVPLACTALLFAAGLAIVGDMVYQLMVDPNAVGVASRLDMFSIDPNNWFPSS